MCCREKCKAGQSDEAKVPKRIAPATLDILDREGQQESIDWQYLFLFMRIIHKYFIHQ
jgi:hypothetical protein